MYFFDPSGQRIVNYPRQHSTNCKTKHQNTEMRFKPVVRMFKNIRGKLVKDRLIARDVAPSYYIEGLLYNVPDHEFTTGHQDCFIDFLNCIRLDSASRPYKVCLCKRAVSFARRQLTSHLAGGKVQKIPSGS